MIDIGAGQVSNAPTALRYFVQDWGVVGSVIFVAFFGAFTGAIHEKVRKGNIYLSSVYALIVPTIIYMPNSWFLSYGTRIFCPIVVTAYYILFTKRVERRPKPRRATSRTLPLSDEEAK